jgi:glycosyltransferase involved in cell wall biosynthesis
MKKKLKIIFFLPTLTGGGAERVVVNLINNIDRGMFEPSILLLHKKGEYFKQVSEDVHINYLEVGHMRYALPKLIKFLNKYSPDVVVTNMVDANITGILANMMTNKKTKIIVVEHSTWGIAKLKFSKYKQAIFTKLMKWLYPKADTVITVSQGVADDLAEQLSLKKEKIKVIYNPIVGEYIPLLSEQKVNHLWFENKQYPVLVAVGRLIDAKDYFTMLKALSIVKKITPVRLMILGQGPLEERLKEFSKGLGLTNYVDFLGFQENPYKYIAKADLLILSSRWEGLPTVLVEALACSTRVISTDCPSGPREILENGEYGVLVPVGDAEKMAEAIFSEINKLKNGDLDFGNELKRRAKDFSIQIACEKYTEILGNQRHV